MYRVDAKDSTNMEYSVSYGTDGDARTEEEDSRIGGPWIHPTLHFTVGSTSVVCQEEGWINVTLHRLQGVEQGHDQE